MPGAATGEVFNGNLKSAPSKLVLRCVADLPPQRRCVAVKKNASTRFCHRHLSCLRGGVHVTAGGAATRGRMLGW